MTQPAHSAVPHARPPDAQEVALHELVDIAWRRKWLLLGGILLGGIAGIALAALIPPSFRATALLLIDPPASFTEAGPAGPAVAVDSAVIDSQVQVLASRSLAREVIDELGPEVARRLAAGDGGSLAALRGRQGAATGAEDASFAPDPVRPFLDRLTVEREGKSQVISLSFTAGDPALAAAVVNKLAEVYTQGQLERKYELARRASDRSGEQLAQARRRLETAEQDLREFRRRQPQAPGVVAAASAAELAELDRQLVAARVERTGRESRLARQRAAVGGAFEDPTGSPALARLEALQVELAREEAELRMRFGERHPRMQDLRSERQELEARVTTEQRRIVESLAAGVAEARGREAALEASLSARRASAQEQLTQAGAVHELERQVELGRRIYEEQLARLEPAAGSAREQEPDARVISEAVPPARPALPQPRLIIGAMLILGLVAGAAGAWLAESGGRGFRTARALREALGLQVLAVVPRHDGRKEAPPHEHILEHRPSRYAESCREVLGSFLLQKASQGATIVLVTSSVPNEGKTTLALSLGRLAALEGLRVLLIDADPRQPVLAERAGLKPGAGLAEVLRGEVPAGESLLRDPRTSLLILRGSRRPAGSTRLLSERGLGLLLARTRSRFDLILLDTAPVLAVADTKLLATHADRILFVVRQDDTARDLVTGCVADLRAATDRSIATVLTQADPKTLAGAAYHGRDLAAYYAD